MQIFVDADACPVVGIVEKVAKEHSVPVTLLCDTNHVFSSDYSEVIVVGAGADAVDYKLISICHKGDIVVSQDYGVAAMALGKNAYVIHQINVRRDYSMISTGPLVDTLGRIALKHKDELILRAKNIISTNKNIVREWLKENPRFECVLPSGGTVCFLKYYFDLKSETFAKLLLAEKGVFFVPGSCFDKEYYFRLGLAQDSKLFKAGLNELSNFVDEHLIS